jgi:hypothetical protein
MRSGSDDPMMLEIRDAKIPAFRANNARVRAVGMPPIPSG